MRFAELFPFEDAALGGQLAEVEPAVGRGGAGRDGVDSERTPESKRSGVGEWKEVGAATVSRSAPVFFHGCGPTRRHRRSDAATQ